MFEKLSFKSRTTEVSDVAQNLIAAYKKSNVAIDSFFSATMDELTESSKMLVQAINQMKPISILEEKDEIRDKHIQTLFQFIQGSVVHPNSVVAASAKEIKKVLDQYGIHLIHESYSSESALVNALLNDLQAAPVQTAIQDLPGCAELVDRVTQAEADFEESRLDFETDKALAGSIKASTKIKHHVVQTINSKVIPYLWAKALAQPDQVEGFAKTLQQIISDNNTMVRKRQSATKTINRPATE